LAPRLGCLAPTSCPKVAKLSVLGTGMRSQTSVAKRLFQSLASAGINVEMINTSEVRLNVVVDGAEGQKAVEVLRNEFSDVMV
jgi:aspartate kinase